MIYLELKCLLFYCSERRGSAAAAGGRPERGAADAGERRVAAHRGQLPREERARAEQLRAGAPRQARAPNRGHCAGAGTS